jgi:hypothetical protein
MKRDVFYFGNKPNAHPKEKFAKDLDDARNKSTTEHFWVIDEYCDYLNFDWDFDFDFLPDDQVWTKDHLNIWPNEYTKNSGTLLCPKIQHEYNIYREDVGVLKFKKESFHDMIYIDRGNLGSNENYEKLKKIYPTLIKVRYFGNWVDSITRGLTKTNSKFVWVLSSEIDYSNFTFNVMPSIWEEKLVNIFGTQWSHWGNTYLINRETFANDTKHIKILEHLDNIHLAKFKKAKAVECLYDIILIDFGNNQTSTIIETLKNKTKKQITVLPYNNSYHETLVPYLKTLSEKRENYLWVCSSVCDYNNFDFSYICDPFAKDQLHVFPSDDQKYGDTFLIDVDKFNTISKLNDYEKINFNQHQRVKRLPCPIIETGETHCNEKYFDFDFPYALFKTFDNYQNKTKIENISLWDKDKTIVCLSEGNTQIVVPKVAKKYLKKELYDYPFMITSDKLDQSEPMDIVFLSNGEKCADEHYDHLLKLGKTIPNKISRVDGIQGRVKSFHAGANNSSTPWFFMVFAKLKVNENFDFNWQPDRLQVPKHYIFYAKNPVNGLIYGHQSMAMYNKNIVLNTEGKLLDFTMEGEHTVVELLSGVANFNTDEYSTWRTAFRECIKLSYQTDLESKERLFVWLNVAKGAHGDYSIKGSQDAVEYFEKVNGNFDDLKLTYEWNWLENYYNKKYK